MKKVAVLGLAVLLLTGCAKTVKCTTKDKDAKIKYSVKGTFITPLPLLSKNDAVHS